MIAFETFATLSDPSHLTLREPVPSGSGRELRVIVLLEEEVMPESLAPVMIEKQGVWVVRGGSAHEAENALERMREARIATFAE